MINYQTAVINSMLAEAYDLCTYACEAVESGGLVTAMTTTHWRTTACRRTACLARLTGVLSNTAGPLLRAVHPPAGMGMGGRNWDLEDVYREA